MPNNPKENREFSSDEINAILDDCLDAGVYITDIDTYEILYLNKTLLQMFNSDDKNFFLGKKCYEVSRGLKEPCDFCTYPVLKKEPSKKQFLEIYNEGINTYLQTADKIIPWENGKKAVFHYVKDMSSIKIYEKTLEDTIKREKILSKISELFVSALTDTDVFNKSLEIVLENLNLNVAYILRKNEHNEFTYLYSFAKNGYEKAINYNKTLTFEPQIFETFLLNKPVLMYKNKRGVSFNLEESFTASKSTRFIAQPILFENNVWAVLLCADSVEKSEYSFEEMDFLKSVSHLFASGLKRMSVEKEILSREKQLSQTAEMLERIFDSMNVFILVTDIETDEIMFMNKFMLDTFQKKRDEVIGKKCYNTLNGFDKRCSGCAKNILAKNMDKEIVWEKYEPSVDMHLQHYDRLIRWPDGKLLHLQTGIDMTQIKKADYDLKKAKVAAETANMSKSVFLANMSHEIRTPLNAIIGLTNLAKKDDIAKKTLNYLDKIESSSQSLLGIINNILDMSKIEANKLELSLGNFSLDRLLRDIQTIVSVRANEKCQILKIVKTAAVPDMFYSDYLRITQVITNLIYNAIKFSPENSEIELNVSAKNITDNSCDLRFDITDHGIGMSKEFVKRVFAPFEQGDTGASRKFGGAGLGLSLSKSIVDIMGGQISVISEENKGSIFTVILPVALFNTQKESDAAQKIENYPFRILEGKNILLVEDIELNREIVIALLEETKVSIDCAANGLEAVQKIIEGGNKYDLVLMDIQMPLMNGYDATKIIRKTHSSLPIVAMTANAFKEDVIASKNAGMNAHIAKPIDETTLLNTVFKYIK